MEEFSADVKDALEHTLQLQLELQTRLTDIESWARRNNIRVHRIVEELCHRSLGPKPPQGANPRSIVIYFQEFKTKELVLRSAWRKGVAGAAVEEMVTSPDGARGDGFTRVTRKRSKEELTRIIQEKLKVFRRDQTKRLAH
uniref:Uncharacterized protein n=1 Tax=Knipowitschia caucasica TaxID=637954 RepID=A0AAV2JXV1_KNICA